MSETSIAPLKFLKTITITVPDDYNHDTRLDSFRNQYFGSFRENRYDEVFTDAKGNKETKLIPGQRLKVDFYLVESNVEIEICKAFLRSQKAILSGAHGLSLVWEQAREKLPINMSIVSCDEEGWIDSDAVFEAWEEQERQEFAEDQEREIDLEDCLPIPGVSFMRRCPDGSFEFEVHNCLLGEGFCLLCFREE